LDEQYLALLANLCIRNIVTSQDTESFEQWLVRESTLEAGSGILNQAIQNDKCTNLAVGIAILANSLLVSRIVSVLVRHVQLLANCSCGFGGTRCLDANDFDQINDTAKIIFLKLLAC